jgi:hypothetical protein
VFWTESQTSRAERRWVQTRRKMAIMIIVMSMTMLMYTIGSLIGTSPIVGIDILVKRDVLDESED